jgi:hypothetical protein
MSAPINLIAILSPKAGKVDRVGAPLFSAPHLLTTFVGGRAPEWSVAVYSEK